MAAPVLVRRRLTKVDRVQFAKDSNISDLQEMQPVKRLLLMLQQHNSGDDGAV